MHPIIAVILLIIGIYLLVRASTSFVKRSSSLATHLGVSQFLIGFTIVAIGTSLPELIAAIVASFRNEGGIIIGNIIGANITNIGLIGGVSGIFISTMIAKTLIKRDGLMMIFVQGIFLILILDFEFSRIDAGLCLFLYAGYMLFLFQKKKEKEEFRSFINYFIKFKYLHTIALLFEKKAEEKPKKKKEEITYIIKDIVAMIISGAILFISADLIIRQVEYFGELFEISKTIIALTVISLGTTLPELGVTISAIKKGLENIAIGNIIGSNIANILFVGGIASIINPINLSTISIYYITPFMIGFSSIFIIFLSKDQKINRIEGLSLFAIYIIFIISLLFFGKI